MANSRQKGAAGEREVAQELFRELGMTFKRDLRQYQQAEYGDLICEDDAFPFVIEVKRHAKGWTCAPAWEVQAYTAAKNAKCYPAVIYRFDGQKWRARIWFDALAEAFGSTAVCGGKADLTIQDFAWVAREIMAGRAAQ
jgi:Holliday junction resolvase